MRVANIVFVGVMGALLCLCAAGIQALSTEHAIAAEVTASR